MKIPHQVAPPPSLQRQFWGRRGNVLFFFFSKIWNIQMFGSREKPFYFSFHLFSFWRCRLKFPPRQPNETHTSKRWGSVRVWGKKAWITGHASLTLLGEMYRECANDCWFKKKTKFFCCWIFFSFSESTTHRSVPVHTVLFYFLFSMFLFVFFFWRHVETKGKNWTKLGAVRFEVLREKTIFSFKQKKIKRKRRKRTK